MLSQVRNQDDPCPTAGRLTLDTDASNNQNVDMISARLKYTLVSVACVHSCTPCADPSFQTKHMLEARTTHDFGS